MGDTSGAGNALTGLAAFTGPAAPFVAAAGLVLGGVGGARSARRKKIAAVWQGRIQSLQNRQAVAKFARDFVNQQQANLVMGVASGADLSSSAVQGQLASTQGSMRRGFSDIAETDFLAGKMNRQLRRAGSAQDLSAIGTVVQGVGQLMQA